MASFDARLVERLLRQAREDDERMSPAPWTDEDDELYFDDRHEAVQLAGYTEHATEGCQQAIARTRNNLPAVVAQLAAAWAHIDYLTRMTQAEPTRVDAVLVVGTSFDASLGRKLCVAAREGAISRDTRLAMAIQLEAACMRVDELEVAVARGRTEEMAQRVRCRLEEADRGDVERGLEGQVASLARRVSELEARPVHVFDKIGADRLADEVDLLVRRRIIDARSPAADALLDYRSPPTSSRSDRMRTLEAEVERLRRVHAQTGPTTSGKGGRDA